MRQSTQIETTVHNAANALAKAGASGNQRVQMTILSEEDAAKLDTLRASLEEAIQDAPLTDEEAEAAFNDIIEEAYQEHPELRDDA